MSTLRLPDLLRFARSIGEPVRSQETFDGGRRQLLRRMVPARVPRRCVQREQAFGDAGVVLQQTFYALRLPAGAQGSDFQKAATRVLYPIGVLASNEVETDGGVDVGPMGPLGVPFFGLAQDGTRYFDLHHTANDTLDKIDPAQLNQNVAAWAGLLWLIADSDVNFRAMKPAAPAAR
jgi:hypothetical protein